jgi:hypothetical protein
MRPPFDVSSRCSVLGGYLGICTLYFPPKKIAQVLVLEIGDSRAGKLSPPFVLSIIDLVTLDITIYAIIKVFLPGFRIRIHLIRIQIQHFRLNTDPDQIRFQGFDDKKREKISAGKKNNFFF